VCALRELLPRPTVPTKTPTFHGATRSNRSRSPSKVGAGRDTLRFPVSCFLAAIADLRRGPTRPRQHGADGWHVRPTASEARPGCSRQARLDGRGGPPRRSLSAPEVADSTPGEPSGDRLGSSLAAEALSDAPRSRRRRRKLLRGFGDPPGTTAGEPHPEEGSE